MSYLKERIKHAVRFRHKRGFGVHSPFMFNLILNVIRDKEKQFTYPEALERAGLLRHREKKVFRLLSRLIRYLKVQYVICIGYNADLLTEYLALTDVQATILSNVPEELEKADFIYIGRRARAVMPEDCSPLTALELPARYLVIADIHKDSYNARLWRQFHDKATVSVDMMWYGLLFFDEKIQKGKYNLII